MADWRSAKWYDQPNEAQEQYAEENEDRSTRPVYNPVIPDAHDANDFSRNSLEQIHLEAIIREMFA